MPKTFPCIPRINTKNVTFDGAFMLSRSLQRANTARCSGFHKLSAGFANVSEFSEIVMYKIVKYIGSAKNRRITQMKTDSAKLILMIINLFFKAR